MIEACIYSDGGGVYRLRVKNHGDSIVCAGVSSLTINAVNYITDRLGCEGALCHGEDGFLDFELASRDNAGARVVLDFAAFGLRQIEEQYNNEIRVYDF